MERPEVSVSDPSRPARPSDLLDDGRGDAPRRRVPIRTWVALGLVGAVAASVAVLVVRDRDHQARERRLDAASRAAVQVALVQLPLSTAVQDADAAVANGEAEQVGLQNVGPVDERVVGLRVLATGWKVQRLDLAVPTGATVPLDVRLDADCGPALLKDDPLQASVTLRTGRGLLTDRVVELGDLTLNLLGPVRQRCHYLGTDDALITQSSNDSDPLQGSTVTLHLFLHNEGRVPLGLSHLRTSPGFAVSSSPRFPLVLPPQTGPTVHALQVVLRLRVSDCVRARAQVVAYVAGTTGPVQPGAILWDLSGATGHGEYGQSDDEYLGRLIARTCGRPVPGVEALTTG